MATLTFDTEVGPRTVELKRANSIGAGPGSIVTLEHALAKGVSISHCEILQRTRSWTLTDCHSMTGTYVNGERVREPRVLASGDVLRVGSVVLVFRDAELFPPVYPKASTGSGTVTLESLVIEGESIMRHACLRITESYRNVGARPVELSHRFRRPSGAWSLAGGHDRWTGLRESPAGFLMRPVAGGFPIGVLDSGKEVVIETNYVQRLESDRGILALTIPAILDAHAATGACRASLDFVARRGASAARSPSHPIIVSPGEDGLRIGFEETSVAVNRDVVLLLEGVRARAFRLEDEDNVDVAFGARYRRPSA